MSVAPNVERRCADCRAEAELHLDAARAESRAGRAQGSAVVAEHMLAAELWSDVAALHDQGAA